MLLVKTVALCALAVRPIAVMAQVQNVWSDGYTSYSLNSNCSSTVGI
jgi:hypothetical protein